MASNNPANEKQQIQVHPTPNLMDVIVFEYRDTNLPKNKDPEYGVTTPTYGNWPNHRLSHISPSNQTGKEKWVYVADRESQDLYNFEFTKADIGGTKFDAVTRTYVTPRANFVETTATMGATMPDVPSTAFGAEYVLARQQQSRIGEQTLDSLYVTEVFTYVRRTTIVAVRMNDESGRVKRSVTDLYYRGETVSGTPIETLAASPTNAYWGQQADGTFRELDQLSHNWFAIIESNVIPEGSVNSAANPARTRIQKRVTPLGTDIIFSEIGAMPSPVPAYGSAHYDAANWPSHKLSFIEPEGPSGLLFKFTYVADRSSQDDYNWEVNGDGVVRTYVIPRALYFARHVDDPAVITDEFTWPDVTTADVRFPQFGFVDDTQVRSNDPEIDSRYVIIKRRFIETVTTEIKYSDQFKARVLITREVVPHTEPVTSPVASTAGTQSEVSHGNHYHNVKITQSLVDEDGVALTYPYTLSTTPGYANYQFPPKLNDATVVWVWAYAESSAAPSSYSEDYFFKWTIVDPRPGPYKATVKRIITDDPDADATADTSLTFIPPPVREAITVGGWWAYSSVKGNRTSATVKEITVPPTIHEAITVDLNDSIGTNTTPGIGAPIVANLDPTPGVTEFLALTEAVIGYQTRDLPFGLYEVSITTIDITNLYDAPP